MDMRPLTNKKMTKKVVKEIAQSLNCEALYSGKERIMYIHGVDEYLAVAAINNSYQPFTVVAGGNKAKGTNP